MTNQSGQIGLVVLLIMTTMVTVGVGAISRSTQDLKITRQELESTNLFNAAEAGIEQAVHELNSGTIDFSTGAHTNTTTINEANVSYEIMPLEALDLNVPENQVLVVDTSTSVNGNTMKVEWAQDQNCEEAASVIIKLYSRTSDVVKTEGYSKCDVRNDGFNVTPTDSGSVSITFFNDEIDYVRIRPVYNTTRITVSAEGGWSLPIQAYEIESVASREDTDERRAIQLTRTIKAPPSIFDFGVVSGSPFVMN